MRQKYVIAFMGHLNHYSTFHYGLSFFNLEKIKVKEHSHKVLLLHRLLFFLNLVLVYQYTHYKFIIPIVHSTFFMYNSFHSLFKLYIVLYFYLYLIGSA